MWGGARWQWCGCLILGFDDFQAQGARAQAVLRSALKMSFLTLSAETELIDNLNSVF
jgi:hypothetical protein